MPADDNDFSMMSELATGKKADQACETDHRATIFALRGVPLPSSTALPTRHGRLATLSTISCSGDPSRVQKVGC